MKLSLRQKMRVVGGMFLAAMLLLMVSVMFNDRSFEVPGLIGVGLMIGALVLSGLWWRCPRCHEPLGRILSPTFCPHCGNEIDYDAK
ncbi:MAG: hypothetical protein J6C43_07125 [Oscillospiraceae bacterium]|nr:hypothetical protein [Oscillospiraceae bacterium]